MLARTLRKYQDSRVLVATLLGIASGTPIALIASTLSWWLDSVGVTLTTIGFFAYARSPYSFKFLWSPFLDKLKLPFFTKKFGQRRGWGIFIQIALIASIIGLGFSDPVADPWFTALMALSVGFFSASQDIIIDAFRIELFEKNEQEMGASAAAFGWRVGSLISGGVAIALSRYMDWGWVYTAMSSLVVVGLVTFLMVSEKTLRHPEPKIKRSIKQWILHAVIEPIAEFMRRDQAILIIAFILVYKLCDAYIGMMSFPFYRRIGFDELQVFGIVKGVGTAATLAGFVAGGLMVSAYGLYRSLWIGGILQILSNFIFAWQAHVGADPWWLTVTITIENFTNALSLVAFTSYLSQLVNVTYTATQYALLTSFMAFPRDIITSSSGILADHTTWVEFFMMSGLLGLPGLGLLWWLHKKGGFKI